MLALGVSLVQGAVGSLGSLMLGGMQPHTELLVPLLSLLVGQDKQDELLWRCLYVPSGHAGSKKEKLVCHDKTSLTIS